MEVTTLATGYSYLFPPLDPSGPCNQRFPINGRRDHEHRRSFASQKRTSHDEPQLSFLGRQADRVSFLVSPLRCFVFCGPVFCGPVIPCRERSEQYCTEHIRGSSNRPPRPRLSHSTHYQLERLEQDVGERRTSPRLKNDRLARASMSTPSAEHQDSLAVHLRT